MSDPDHSDAALRAGRSAASGNGLALLHFVAILLTALALVPAGAHLFELPNKMALGAREYFIVQQLYRGWNLFGIVLFAAIAVNLLLAWTLRKEETAFRLALAGFLLMTTSLAIFLVWTYPANLATSHWTVIPGDWAELRDRWEYSHAAASLTTFLALCSVTACTCARLAPPAGEEGHALIHAEIRMARRTVAGRRPRTGLDDPLLSSRLRRERTEW